MQVKLKVLALVAAAFVVPGAASAQDATKGEQVFKQCMTCHRIGPDAKNLVGPVLTGVIGRQSGTAPGFAYSALNKSAGENGLVWSDDAEQKTRLTACSSPRRKSCRESNALQYAEGASNVSQIAEFDGCAERTRDRDSSTESEDLQTPRFRRTPNCEASGGSMVVSRS